MQFFEVRKKSLELQQNFKEFRVFQFGQSFDNNIYSHRDISIELRTRQTSHRPDLFFTSFVAELCLCK